MTFAARLVAYNPGSDTPLGFLPEPLSWSCSLPHNDVGALSIKYTSASVGGDLVTRGLSTGLDVSVEVNFGGGWFEPYGARFMLRGRSQNLTDPTGALDLTLLSYAAILGDMRNLKLEALETSGDFAGQRLFTNINAGKVLRTLLDEYASRHVLPSALTWDFTATKDSAGVDWPVTDWAVPYPVGTDLRTVLGSEQSAGLTSMGLCDWRTRGRMLKLWKKHTLAVDRSALVRLVLGLDVMDAPVSESLDGTAGYLLVQGDQQVVSTVVNPAAPQAWGVSEGYLAASGATTVAAAEEMVALDVERRGRETAEYTQQLTMDPDGALPLRDYLPGDLVSAETGAGFAPMRVLQVSLQMDSGNVSGSVILNDRLVPGDLQVAGRLRAVVGGSGSAGTGVVPDAVPIAQDAKEKADAAQGAADAAQAAADAAQAAADAAITDAGTALAGVGEAVASSVIEYAVGGSESVAPNSGWSTNQPARTPGSFVWMRMKITRNNGTTAMSAAALVTGNAGSPGDKGDPGSAGVSVTNITSLYLLQGAGGAAPAAPSARFQHHIAFTNTGTCYPGNGGFFPYPERLEHAAGKIFLQRITAKLPVGMSLDMAANTAGSAPGAEGRDVTTGTWLTPSVGTGEWQEYVRLVVCGTTGSFSIGGLIYMVGPTPTPANPTTWWLAEMRIVDVTATPNPEPARNDLAYWLERAAHPNAVTETTDPLFANGMSAIAEYDNTASGNLTLTRQVLSDWVLSEPGYVAGQELWRTERITFSDGSYAYTTPQKSSAYAAAVYIGNLADAATKGLIASSATDPGHYEGRLWLQLDGSGQMIGIKRSSGTVWQSYQQMADAVLVPGSAGSIVLQDGAVTAQKIGATAVTANHIKANSVEAGHLETVLSVSNTIIAGDPEGPHAQLDSTGFNYTTGGTGKRLELGGADPGLTIYDADGDPATSLTAEDSFFTGDVAAATFKATRNFTLLQGAENQIEAGAELVLAAGVTRPAGVPTVTSAYETLALNHTPVPGYSRCVGMTLMETTGKMYGLIKAGEDDFGIWDGKIVEWASDGTSPSAWSVTPTLSPGGGPTVRLASMAGHLLVLSYYRKVGNNPSDEDYWGEAVIEVVNPAIRSVVSTIHIISETPAIHDMFGDFVTISTSGTKLILAGNKRYATWTIDTSSWTESAEANYATPKYTPHWILRGSYDFGTERVLAVGTDEGTNTALGYTTASTAAKVTDLDFPTHSGMMGFAYYSGKWYGLRRIADGQYQRITYEASQWAGADQTKTHYIKATYMNTAGTYQSLPTAGGSGLVNRRARFSMTLPDFAPDAGKSIDKVRFYAGTAAGTLYTQGESTTKTKVVSTLAVSGATPPATNSYPAGQNGVVKSASGAMEVRGDGSAAFDDLTADSWNLKVSPKTTFSTSPTGSGWWRTYGPFVEIWFKTTSNVAAGGNTNIYTLPAAARPPAEVSIACSGGVYGYQPASGQIGTDGVIAVKNTHSSAMTVQGHGIFLKAPL